jgi:phage terminase large subunit-like protein
LWSILRSSTLNGWLDADLNEIGALRERFLGRDWQFWARDDQLPPGLDAEGRDWRVWMILGGRGAGKTRAGAEWVRMKALGLLEGDAPARRIALVGETFADVRRVMIEGVSGLLAVHKDTERPSLEISKGELHWPNGSIAQVFSAETPDALRGPQFECAWVDELAKWRTAQETWDMLQLGLRLGNNPQALVTTTPRPLPLLKRIMDDTIATAVTHAPMAANFAFLAPGFIDEMRRRYDGTALGRQELLGEIVDERAGALWRRDWIEVARLATAPELVAVVVAVDPPVTATVSSDACGIVVAGMGADRRAYILADRTLQGREPNEWARAAVAAYRDFMADRVVAETNQGGDLVAAIIRQVDENVPVRQVRATRGKWLRAEPVASLYAEGRVSHVGSFAKLEDQMCAFGADGLAKGRSPDRLDALVWALTDLMIDGAGAARVRAL